MFTQNLLIPGRVLTCRRGRRRSCGRARTPAAAACRPAPAAAARSLTPALSMSCNVWEVFRNMPNINEIFNIPKEINNLNVTLGHVFGRKLVINESRLSNSRQIDEEKLHSHLLLLNTAPCPE